MKTNFTLLLFAIAVVLMSFTLAEQSTCDSPVVGGHTGAPGSPSCVACHGGTANTGTGSLTVDFGGATTYTPGQSYNVAVTMQQGTLDKFGFAIAARKAGNVSAGTFIVQDSTNTRSFTDAGDWYFSHTPCGADALTAGSRTWTFQWQAPATDEGAITFYTAGLAANHNHALSGDDTYTNVLTLDVTTGISGVVADNAVTVYPTPSNDEVMLLSNENISRITLRNSLGQVFELPVAVAAGKSYTIGKSQLGLQAGMYYVTVESATQRVVKKIVFL